MAESLGVLEIALGVDLGELVSGFSKGEQLVAGFTAGMVELGSKCVEAASEAQTAATQVVGVFGKLSPMVDEFAETFAKSAGRATSDIQGMVSSFGAMIGPMLKSKETAAQMSEGLTEMSTNLAKAAHISADQAMGAIQAGLAGHGRELARLGISMDEATLKNRAMMDGLGDYSKLSKAQQEMVAYQTIMAQQAQVSARAAQADGTYAEQVNRLNANVKEAAEAFGSDLMPYAAQMLTIVNALAAGFADLSPQVRTGIEAFLGLAAAIGAVATAEALFNGELAETIAKAAAAYAEAALAALPLIAAVAAAGLAVGYLYAEWKKAGLNISEVIEGIRDTIMDAMGPALKWLGDAWSTMWDGVKDATAAVRDVIFSMIEGTMAGLARLLSALGSTGHADWATSAAAGLNSGIGSMEGARTSMTAQNIGSGAAGIGAQIEKAGSALWDQLKDAGSSFGGMVKEGAGGFIQMLKDAMGGITKSSASIVAPTIAALTKSQLMGEAGSGTGGGFSGPSASGFSSASLGKESGLMDASFAKVNASIVDATTGLINANDLEKSFFRDQEDAIGESRDQLATVSTAQQALAGDFDTLIANMQQTIDEAAQKFHSSLMSELTSVGGVVGGVINAAMQGFSAGGIWGAIIAAFIQLMQSCQGFQQVLNVLNSTGDMVANAFSSIFQNLEPMVGSIQNALAPLMQGLAKIFQALAPIFQLLGTSVQMCQPIFDALGQVLGAIATLLGDVLNPILKALAPSFQTLSDIFSALGIVIKAIAGAIGAIAGVLGDVLGPIMKGVGYIFQGVGIVVDGIMLGLADAWNGIAAAIAWVANAIIGVINGVIGALNSALGFLGVNISQMNQLSQASISIDTSGLQQSLTNMENGNYQLADSQGALTAATDQAAAALTNLPTGYKIALAEFQNMNYGNNTATTGNSSTGVGSTSTPLLAPPAGITSTGGPVQVGGSYQQQSASTTAAPGSIIANAAAAANAAWNSDIAGGDDSHGAWDAAYQAALGSLTSAGISYATAQSIAAVDANNAQVLGKQPGPQARALTHSGGTGGFHVPGTSSAGGGGGGGGGGSDAMTIIIENINLSASDPASFLKQLKQVTRTAAMSKYGRTLPTTRFSLPNDTR